MLVVYRSFRKNNNNIKSKKLTLHVNNENTVMQLLLVLRD